MIQSVKVDIVYYSTGSDFEMEFNLCGCCRMRLLTDKAYSQSEFSKSLARAVKRSKVIILCGPLFGEKGLIATVAKVTGIDTEQLDKTAYDLDDADADIDILKGSTALVTEDGIFGGCIIESNTQSIIILSEGKSLRKNIMKQLIYPYITKLSIMPELDDEAIENEEPESELVTETIDEEITVKEDLDVDGAEESKTDNDAPSDSDASDEVSDTPDDAEKVGSEGEDFVIDISSANIADKSATSDERTNIYDNDLIFEIPRDEKNMSVEEKNQKYYLFEDEGEEFNDYSKYNVAIRIILVFIVLIALLMAYFAIAKPLILHKSILTYLREIFSSKVSVNIVNPFSR